MSGRYIPAVGRVLAIAALALTAIPFGAEAEVAGVSPTVVTRKPPPGMLEALARDLGITREQAQARLLNEARLIPVEAQLRRRLGARFGGSWLGGAVGQTLVVASTSSADIPQIIAAGAQAEVVAKSLEQLSLIKQKLDAVLPVQPIVASVRYVDVKTNSVVVLTQDPTRAQNVIESSGVDRSAVLVRTSTEMPRPLTDLVGGNAYYINGTTRCSIGFPVVRGAVNGFVSAGHCGKAGNTTAGFNRVAQGVFQASTFPSSDYSWVAVNSGWTARPAVDNGAGGTIPIAGARVALEGTSVCRSGSTTGFHCGLIQQRDASVTYPQGKVFGLTRTNVCAEPGDSGGSFISTDQAQGVTSGGSGDCSSGGTTYFQPIAPILTAYGLSLVTTAGNPPPPTTGTCTGYPNTYSGTLSIGKSAYQPNNSYFRSNVTGLHTACLDGPDGVDFDLYLQKWNGASWVNVAAGTSAGPDERISYTGTAGYYRYRVFPASGSGPYTLGYKAP